MSEYKVGSEPVPGYKLTRFLGRGGFGQVWEARGPGGVDVALKIIDLAGGNGIKEFRAVGLVKKLHNPNLVPLHGYWLKDVHGRYHDPSVEDSVSLTAGSKQLVIAMGLGEKSLATRLTECRDAGLVGIPVDELLDFMNGAARAIDYLNQPVHNLGGPSPAAIHHGDIKPANLLVVGNGVQLCDYGLARTLGEDARKTQSAGSPAYSAPEQFANKPHPRSDQYALAISYYELRTGRLPIDETAAAYAHINGLLDFSLVGSAEQEVLRRATHVRPADRFPTTTDFVRALREAVAQKTSGQMSAPALPPAASIDEMITAGRELVPQYKLVKLLGRGGYGEVWEARGPGGMRCAMKIVRHLDAGKGRQEYKSLDLIRDLEHDRLINLRAYWLLAADGTIIPDDLHESASGPTPSALVMATDLAAKNLLHRLQECRTAGDKGMPLGELLAYTRQAADAIDYLNDHGIQHRDIKPENILITRDGRVKVSDFGLAKLVEGVAADIHSGSVGLTTAYAAPEVFQNSVSRWTDQYSLALTYYKLRTGRWPFKSDLGPLQIMIAHTEGKLDLSAVGDAERMVLAKATALRPTDRYGTCREFAAELNATAGGTLPEVPDWQPLAIGHSSATAVYVEKPTSPEEVKPHPAHGFTDPVTSHERIVPHPASVAASPPAPPPAELPARPVMVRPGAPVGGTLMLHRDAIDELFPQAEHSTDEIGGTVGRVPSRPRPRPGAKSGRGVGLLVAGGLTLGLGATAGFYVFGPKPPSETRPEDARRDSLARDVDSRLAAREFAAAAKLLRGQGAPELEKRVRQAWAAAAAKEPDRDLRLLTYDEYLAAYPDAEVQKQRDALRAEMTAAVAAASDSPEAKRIEAQVPTLTAATDWAKLLEQCRLAPATPVVVACRAECVAELRRAGKPDGDVEAERAKLAKAPTSSYVAYVRAQLDDLAGDAPAVAARLIEAYPVSGEPHPAVAGPFRVGRSAAALVRTLGHWAAQPGGPPTAAQPATELGQRLVKRTGVPPAVRTALDVHRLMVLPSGDAQAAALAKRIDPDKEKLRPVEAYAVYAARARTDTKAARSALRLARDNPSTLPPTRVFTDLVKPALDDPKAAAGVVAAAAAAMRADLKAWSAVPGVGADAPKKVLDLYDRAYKADPQPEYLAGRLLAEYEQTEATTPRWAELADAKSDDPEVLIVRGAVLLNRGKLAEADACYEMALKASDLRPDDRAIALEGRSEVARRLSRAATDRAGKAEILGKAEEFARATIALNAKPARANVALGEVLEEQAAALGEAAKFSDAAAAFNQAVEVEREERKPDLRLRLGRCRFEWGRATTDVALLRFAKGDFDQAANEARAARRNELEAWALIASARVSEALRNLARKSDPTAADAALNDALKALKRAAEKPSSDEALAHALDFRSRLLLEDAEARVGALRTIVEKQAAYANDAAVRGRVDEAVTEAGRLDGLKPARAALVRGRAFRMKVTGTDKEACEAAAREFEKGIVAPDAEDALVVELCKRVFPVYETLNQPAKVLDAARRGEKRVTAALEKAEMAYLTGTAMYLQASKDGKGYEAAVGKIRDAVKDVEAADKAYPDLWLWKYQLGRRMLDQVLRGTESFRGPAVKVLEESQTLAPDAKEKKAIQGLIDRLKESK